MSVEQNKALVRRLVEGVFGRGDVRLVDEILAPSFVEREELPPGVPGGREAPKQMTAMMRSAFPDLEVRIDDVIAEGDKVAIRWTARGTQRGEFMGVPPTGKRVSLQVIDIIRIADGQAVEHWGSMDMMSVMRQLGAIPAGAPMPA